MAWDFTNMNAKGCRDVAYAARARGDAETARLATAAAKLADENPPERSYKPRAPWVDPELAAEQEAEAAAAQRWDERDDPKPVWIVGPCADCGTRMFQNKQATRLCVECEIGRAHV